MGRMYRSIFAASLFSFALFAPEGVGGGGGVGAVAEAAPKETKSIVPPKYAGKYKGGGEGPLSEFIRSECGTGDKFEFTKFFDLCRKNGIAEDQVAKYESAVAEKAQGANGRARMTLANTLRAKARKDQTLVNLNGTVVAVPEPKIAASGAVKAAQEAKAAVPEKEPEGEASDEDDGTE